MRIVAWMAALSAGSAAAATMAFGAGLEIWLGMLAPLVAVSASWITAARTYNERPEQLTSVMMTAFAGKLLLFAGYVALVLAVVHARPIPFVLSFVAYFIALYTAEAVCLRNLFAERMRAV
jgi:hypothetical protein